MASCCYDYTQRQRVAFYMVSVGLALCILGCASPYWMSAKVVTEKSRLHLPDLTHTGATRTVEVNVGLWWYCLGFHAEDTVCFTYALDGDHHNQAYIMFVRVLMCSCLVLAFVGLLCVCYYCCSCCARGNTLGFGLVFFMAGTLGFAAVFILTFKVDVLLSTQDDSNARFGWAFPVFVTGSSLMMVASLLLCLPTYQKGGSHYETMLAVDIPQHELTGQIGAFEALPEPATLTICKTSI